ncbi:uncharacterized protein [Euphorbia lathyris]|uniref:uncharacterized protein isoform X2 n=1 Tax=Euphorbia lathyris TaxID=212925 RepID=UPI003314078F
MVFWFEVSKLVWKMVLSKPTELRAYDYHPFASRNGGRYMPYSFVDSFLKMCKILGLDGIDLFSPSDVVEKGDTRKVCMCLRALSNKARSLHLNVPDFDIVTSTVAMPTDMVGYIRRSWELSLSEYSSSSTLIQHHKLRQRSSQERLIELCGRNYLSVKEFGDSEINSMLQSDSTTSNYLYNSSSDLSSGSVKVKNVCSVHLGVETQEKDESSHCQQEEFSSSKLDGSFFLHQFGNNQEENVESPSVVDSNSQSGGSFVNVESGGGNSYKSNLMEQIYHNLNLGDSLQCSQQAVSAIMGNGAYTDDSSILDDNSSIFNECVVGTSSCCSKKMSDGNEYTSQFLDGDDVERSSVGSVNSMSIYVRNLDFDDELEIQESFPETKLDEMSKKVTEGFNQDIMEHGRLDQILLGNKKEESLPKCCIACSDKYTTPVMPYDKNISKSLRNLNTGVFVADSHGFSRWDQKGKCQIAVVPTGNVGYQSPSLLDSYEQNVQCIQGEVIGDALQHDKINSIVAENDKDARKQTTGCSQNIMDISSNIVENGNMKKKAAVEEADDDTMGIAKRKLPLLKAVVSGTAVAGATLLLLQFRKNSRENGVRSRSGRNLTSAKTQKAPKADEAYPAEKLKL